MFKLKTFLKKCLGFFNLLSFIFKFYKLSKNTQVLFIFPYYHLGGAEKVHLNLLKSDTNLKKGVLFTHHSATNHFYKDFESHAELLELNAILNKKSSILNKILLHTISYFIDNSKTLTQVFSSNTLFFYSLLPYLKTNVIKTDLIHAFEVDDAKIPFLIKSATTINTRIVITQNGLNTLTTIYANSGLDASLNKSFRLIPNGIEASTPAIYTPKQVPIAVGFVGRWSEEKRPELFLQVAKALKKEYPAVKFYVAGSGLSTKKDYLESLGIVCLGALQSPATLNQLYQQLHFIVITSVYEGFPMVLMEAMFHGVLPICTDVGGVNEHIKHLENGFLVSVEDETNIVKEMVVHLKTAIQDVELKNALSLNAFTYAKNHFSIGPFQSAYHEILNQKKSIKT